jgi:hypothetical protein
MLLAGCTDASGLGTLINLEPGRTFSGSVSGSAALDPKLKVLVVPGVASDPGGPRSRAVAVSGGRFTIQASQADRYLTIFAFSDANGNDRFDAGEQSSFGATGSNTYYQLAWNGSDWTVTEVSAGGPSSKPSASASLDIVFNA